MARVLRGGAFNNQAENVRCAVRNRNNPTNRNRNIGFRVVASHVILSPERVFGLPEMPGGWARSARFPAEVVNDGAVRVLAARATSL